MCKNVCSWRGVSDQRHCVGEIHFVNSLCAKSVLAGEKLVAKYSIST